MINQRNSTKRDKGTTGMKVFIATASVAATVAGWALLPANDPASAASANNNQTTTPDQQPVTLPQPFGSTDTAPQSTDPQNTAPQSPSNSQLPLTTDPNSNQNQTLPNYHMPSGNNSFPMPFTRSHSSR